VSVSGRRCSRLGIAALAASAIGFTAVSAEAHPGPLHFNAVIHKPGRQGKVLTSKETLYESGKVVGQDVSRCTETPSSRLQCRGTYTLHNGTIRFAGTIGFGNNRIPITGGTGTYRGAHGTVSTIFNKTETRATETLMFR
jgi:hypothetical protein